MELFPLMVVRSVFDLPMVTGLVNQSGDGSSWPMEPEPWTLVVIVAVSERTKGVPWVL